MTFLGYFLLRPFTSTLSLLHCSTHTHTHPNFHSHRHIASLIHFRWPVTHSSFFFPFIATLCITATFHRCSSPSTFSTIHSPVNQCWCTPSLSSHLPTPYRIKSPFNSSRRILFQSHPLRPDPLLLQTRSDPHRVIDCPRQSTRLAPHCTASSTFVDFRPLGIR